MWHTEEEWARGLDEGDTWSAPDPWWKKPISNWFPTNDWAIQPQKPYYYMEHHDPWDHRGFWVGQKVTAHIHTYEVTVKMPRISGCYDSNAEERESWLIWAAKRHPEWQPLKPPARLRPNWVRIRPDIPEEIRTYICHWQNPESLLEWGNPLQDIQDPFRGNDWGRRCPPECRRGSAVEWQIIQKKPITIQLTGKYVGGYWGESKLRDITVQWDYKNFTVL